MRKALVVLTGLLALAACQDAEKISAPGPLAYGSFGTIQLDVAKVDIVNSYRPTGALPFIDQQMNPTPEQAIQRWALDRLSAGGMMGGRATVMIREASMRREGLTTKGGISGEFTREQDEKLVVKLVVDVNVQNPPPGFNGFASAQATASTSVAEGTDAVSRRNAAQRLLERAMLQLNDELERQIRSHLAPAIKP